MFRFLEVGLEREIRFVSKRSEANKKKCVSIYHLFFFPWKKVRWPLGDLFGTFLVLRSRVRDAVRNVRSTNKKTSYQRKRSNFKHVQRSKAFEEKTCITGPFHRRTNRPQSISLVYGAALAVLAALAAGSAAAILPRTCLSFLVLLRPRKPAEHDGIKRSTRAFLARACSTTFVSLTDVSSPFYHPPENVLSRDTREVDPSM